MFSSSVDRKAVGMAIGLTLGISGLARAQSIFFSEVGTVGGGATAGDPLVTHTTAETNGSLFIWVTDEHRVNQSFALDLSSATPGVVQFTAAAVFNPFVDLGIPAVSDDRWQGVSAPTVSANSISNMTGVAVTEGFGFNTAVSIYDPLYDSVAGAWLFARVDYSILGVGLTTLHLAVGAIDIVDNGVSVAGLFDYGTATIEVIPEPMTLALLLGAASVGPLLRRRSGR